MTKIKKKKIWRKIGKFWAASWEGLNKKIVVWYVGMLLPLTVNAFVSTYLAQSREHNQKQGAIKSQALNFLKANKACWD